MRTNKQTVNWTGLRRCASFCALSLMVAMTTYGQGNGNGNGGGGNGGGGKKADVVNVTNDNGFDVGILVDGKVKKNSDSNDDDYIFSGGTTTVTNYDLGANNEIIAFTEDRPVQLITTIPWTSDRDTVTVDFDDVNVIDLTIWVVFAPNGDFAAQEAKIMNDVLTTANYFKAERLGVTFGNVNIIDATADPDAPTYYPFTCALRTGIQNDIGQVAGQINIYYTETVDGGTGRGQACQIGSDFAAMASNTGNELLSHELGHDFYLFHINSLTQDFNQTNIMHSASNTREWLTEGQTFRATFQSSSALNFLYNVRPGIPFRSCSSTGTTRTDQCPEIQRRLWSDGTYQPN